MFEELKEKKHIKTQVQGPGRSIYLSVYHAVKTQNHSA